jgi:hypothetical protein
MRAYICDMCNRVLKDPYEEKVTEFHFSVSNCDEYPVPTKEKRKRKIHLCYFCLNDLHDIALKRNKEGGVK